MKFCSRLRYLLAFSVLYWLPFAAQAQDTAYYSFLRNNNAPFSNTDAVNPLFDTAFYHSRYFLFGEIHGSAQPQLTDYALFTHLHRRAGIRHYLAEVDYTKAWLLNRYLSNGDTNLLKAVFASWRSDTAQWANKEHYTKWQRLRQWQQGLPKAQRFTVMGIDVPQDYALLAQHLHTLTGSRKWGVLKPQVDSLLLLADAAERKPLIAYAKRMLPMVDATAGQWRKTMGDNFVSFRHLLQVLSWLDAGNTRDMVMWLNYQAQAAEGKFGQKPVYGFLGFFHCLQTSYNKAMPFAALLRQHAGNNSRVTTLAMLSIDSKTILPYAGIMRQVMPLSRAQQLWAEQPQFGSAKMYVPFDMSNTLPTMKVEGINLLDSFVPPASVHLFRLTGNNSPFAQSRQLAEVGGFQSLKLTNNSDHTTDAFQYILLFRNSPAATPLD